MKSLFLLVLFILFITFLWSFHSGEFMIGCFGYLHDTYNVSFNSALIEKMAEADYNATVWSSRRKRSERTHTLNLINSLNNNGLDSFIMDYNNEYDADGELISAGIHTLSTGNKWTFEAEYRSREALVGNDNLSNDLFTKFSPASNYLGHYQPDETASNNYTWKCTAGTDSAGIVLDDLRCRWPKADAGHNAPLTGSENYPIISKELEFALWDHTYDSCSPDSLYLKYNDLYVSFIYRIGDYAPLDSIALSFKCRFKKNGGSDTDNWYDVTIKNILNPSENAQVITCTFGQLLNSSYSSFAYPADPNNPYRKVTFSIRLIDLA